MSANTADDGSVKALLERAARAAMRGHGCTAPNPMVGAIVVRDGRVLGIGHHRVYGNLHAEREALASCTRSGHDPRGATIYCTLEPCSHHGQQPPCCDAVIEAGLAKVVFSRFDPAARSGGGAERLRAAGIEVVHADVSLCATAVSDSFVTNVKLGRSHITAKWAQTLDGRMATRTGESQWVTGPMMRRRVHRMRARTDAVVVGVGTVLADDPSLTARDTRRVRRVARRVVLDTHGRTPANSKLIATANEVPTVVVTANSELQFPGVRMLRCPTGADGRLDLEAAFGLLWTELGVSTALVESGPLVLGSLMDADLVDEAFVHLAPTVLGDNDAKPAASGRTAPSLADARRFELMRVKALDGDLELRYRRASGVPD